MDSCITQAVDSIPSLIRNTYLNVNLSGWPAAAAVIAICGSGVIIYALRITHHKKARFKENNYAVNRAA